jgi:hypothetical protein
MKNKNSFGFVFPNPLEFSEIEETINYLEVLYEEFSTVTGESCWKIEEIITKILQIKSPEIKEIVIDSKIIDLLIENIQLFHHLLLFLFCQFSLF